MEDETSPFLRTLAIQVPPSSPLPHLHQLPTTATAPLQIRCATKSVLLLTRNPWVLLPPHLLQLPTLHQLLHQQLSLPMQQPHQPLLLLHQCPPLQLRCPGILLLHKLCLASLPPLSRRAAVLFQWWIVGTVRVWWALLISVLLLVRKRSNLLHFPSASTAATLEVGTTWSTMNSAASAVSWNVSASATAQRPKWKWKDYISPNQPGMLGGNHWPPKSVLKHTLLQVLRTWRFIVVNLVQTIPAWTDQHAVSDVSVNCIPGCSSDTFSLRVLMVHLIFLICISVIDAMRNKHYYRRQKCVCSLWRTDVYYMILFPMRCM